METGRWDQLGPVGVRAPLHPLVVLPVKLAEIADDGGRLGWMLKGEAVSGRIVGRSQRDLVRLGLSSGQGQSLMRLFAILKWVLLPAKCDCSTSAIPFTPQAITLPWMGLRIVMGPFSVYNADNVEAAAGTPTQSANSDRRCSVRCCRPHSSRKPRRCGCRFPAPLRTVAHLLKTLSTGHHRAKDIGVLQRIPDQHLGSSGSAAAPPRSG